MVSLGYDKSSRTLWKANQRKLDKEIGFMYRNNNDSLPGETFTQYKRRITQEEIQSIRETANKIYPAWVRMPNETQEEFRRRLVAKREYDGPTFPAWKQMPGESLEEFRKRFTAKKLDTRI